MLEKPFNLQVRDLKNNLRQTIVKSGMAVSIVKMALGEVVQEVNAAELQQLQFEQQQYNEELERLEKSKAAAAKPDPLAEAAPEKEVE